MEEKVIRILMDFIEPDKASGNGIPEDTLPLDACLTADLGLSSLDVIDVVMAFEEEFGIGIPDEDIMGLVTVGDIVDYLEGHL